jgi:integrase
MGVQKRFLKKVGEYRYRYLGSCNGLKYTSPSIYETRKDAEDAERLHKLKLKGEHQFLEEFIDLRLDQLRVTKSYSYWRENKTFLGMLLEHTGNIPIKHVTKGQINKLLLMHQGDLQRRNKTAHHVNYLMRALKAFFNYVIEIEEVEMKNPLKGLQKFSVKHRLKYIPSQAQVEEVALHLIQHQWELYRFVDETACRVGEALRMKGKDLQPRGRHPRLTLWTMKSRYSDLTPRLVPFAKCLRGRSFRPEERVFPEWDTYPAFLYKTVTALNFKRPWNWHNLRHRRASIWAHDGMNILEIMRRLGHSNLTTTQKYLQLLGFTY